jgi:adenylate cyclase
LKRIFKINAATITVAIILLGMFAYGRVPFLDLMELKTLDLRFRSRGLITPGPEVVLAVVDEKSLEAEGKWIWPRAKFAKLIEILSESGAAVIAFDIGFLEHDRQSTLDTVNGFEKVVRQLGIRNSELDAYLGEAKQRGDNDRLLANAIEASEATVVLGYFFQMSSEGLEHVDKLEVENQLLNAETSRYQLVRFTSEAAETVPLQEAFMPQSNIAVIAEAAPLSGYFNSFPDEDGGVRWVPLVVRCRGELYAPLAIKAIEAYVARPPIPLIADYGVEEVKIGKLSLPTDELGRFMVNFRGPGKTFPHISITDILQGRVSPEALRDRIVLVGATAMGIFDMRVTPFDNLYPGLEIHANIIDNILYQDFLHRPAWASIFDLVAIGLIGLTLGTSLPRLRPLAGALIAAVLFVGYLFLCYYLFAQAGAWLNLVYPIMVLVLIYVSLTAYKYFTEERQKKFIREAFSTYLAPSVVTQLIKSPEKLVLGGEERVITAFFSDVQGFTSISERLNPRDLVELLNEFLTEMTEVILGYQGTVDKFEGDAIIAFFGAPTTLEDHASMACKACIDMQKKLVALRAKWRGENRPELMMRIGMNSGSAVVGNMGSKSRMDYTMMGDTVNTAARLEGVNKVYGTYTMISDTVYSQAKNDIFVRELDRVKVVGKGEPVVVYELLGNPGEGDEAMKSLVNHYARGLLAYRDQRWDEALGHFSAALSINPQDGPSLTMTGRCRELKVRPPGKDWDGVFSATSK